jgi:hypothetical protein
MGTALVNRKKNDGEAARIHVHEGENLRPFLELGWALGQHFGTRRQFGHQ